MQNRNKNFIFFLYFWKFPIYLLTMELFVSADLNLRNVWLILDDASVSISLKRESDITLKIT